MLLLEDLDLLTKTGAGDKSAHRTNNDKWSKLQEMKRTNNSRSGLLVLERLEGNSLDAHDV